MGDDQKMIDLGNAQGRSQGFRAATPHPAKDSNEQLVLVRRAGGGAGKEEGRKGIPVASSLLLLLLDVPLQDSRG